jgi:cell wall assembly regulator SMI1
MFKASATTLLLTTSFAIAQEAPVQSPVFIARQQCGIAEDIARESGGEYGEKILFTGKLYQNHAVAGPVWTDFVFAVNQDTGTWSLVSLLDGVYACYVANGLEFEAWTK